MNFGQSQGGEEDERRGGRLRTIAVAGCLSGPSVSSDRVVFSSPFGPSMAPRSHRPHYPTYFDSHYYRYPPDMPKPSQQLTCLRVHAHFRIGAVLKSILNARRCRMSGICEPYGRIKGGVLLLRLPSPNTSPARIRTANHPLPLIHPPHPLRALIPSQPSPLRRHPAHSEPPTTRAPPCTHNPPRSPPPRAPSRLRRIRTRPRTRIPPTRPPPRPATAPSPSRASSPPPHPSAATVAGAVPTHRRARSSERARPCLYTSSLSTM